MKKAITIFIIIEIVSMIFGFLLGFFLAFFAVDRDALLKMDAYGLGAVTSAGSVSTFLFAKFSGTGSKKIQNRFAAFMVDFARIIFFPAFALCVFGFSIGCYCVPSMKVGAVTHPVIYSVVGASAGTILICIVAFIIVRRAKYYKKFYDAYYQLYKVKMNKSAKKDMRKLIRENYRKGKSDKMSDKDIMTVLQTQLKWDHPDLEKDTKDSAIPEVIKQVAGES